MRNTLMILIATLFGLTTFVASASADPGAGRAACGEDVERLCGDIDPGQGRTGRKKIRQCLIENADQLSAPCQQHIENKLAKRKARKAARKQMKADCAADREQFCADAQGKRAVKQCMIEHQAELSAVCQPHVEKMHARKMARQERKQAFKQACMGDVQTYCADVELGRGRRGKRAMRRCLHDNKASLSAACLEVINRPRHQ